MFGLPGGRLAPSFLQKPVLEEDEVNNLLVLRCKVKANPLPTVQWFHEDVELDLQGAARTQGQIIKEGQNIYSIYLFLRDAVEEDVGQYKIFVTNGVGGITATLNLNFNRTVVGIVL